MKEKQVINYLRLHISNDTLSDKVIRLPRFLDLFTDNWIGDNTFWRDSVVVKADIGDATYKEFLLEFSQWKVGLVHCDKTKGELSSFDSIRVYDFNRSDFGEKNKKEFKYIISPNNSTQVSIHEEFVISKNTIIEFDVPSESSCILTIFPTITVSF